MKPMLPIQENANSNISILIRLKMPTKSRVNTIPKNKVTKNAINKFP